MEQYVTHVNFVCTYYILKYSEKLSLPTCYKLYFQYPISKVRASQYLYRYKKTYICNPSNLIDSTNWNKKIYVCQNITIKMTRCKDAEIVISTNNKWINLYELMKMIFIMEEATRMT